MKRAIIFAYGIAAYVLFLVVFSYMAGFLLSFPVPKGINSESVSDTGTVNALCINIGLIALFGFFHSLLARGRVKAGLLKVLPWPGHPRRPGLS